MSRNFKIITFLLLLASIINNSFPSGNDHEKTIKRTVVILPFYNLKNDKNITIKPEELIKYIKNETNT